MIMANFDFLSEPIRFEEGQVQVLCLEDQKLFRNTCNAFVYNEMEENHIVLSKDFIPFKHKGNICVINDFLSLSYSNTIIKRLYEHIENYCNNEEQTETIALKTHLIHYMESLVNAFEYDFDFNYDIDLSHVFKMMDLTPATDKVDALNNLLNYILIINKYAPPHCFVLINLHLYFTKEELELFYKDLLDRHISILVLENRHWFEKSKLENTVIYDSDFCEIVET